jgi:hypothetical protein
MVTKDAIERQIVEMVGEYIENRQNYPRNAVLGIHKTDLYMFIDHKSEFNSYYNIFKLSELIADGKVDLQKCKTIANDLL